MPIPTTTGTITHMGNQAVRIAVLEAPTATALAAASTSALGTVTLNAGAGVITTPAITTSLAYILAVSNSVVSSSDIVWIGIQAGTNTSAAQVSPGIVTLANGSFSVALNNTQTTALNGTLLVTFEIIKMVAATAVE